MWPVYHWIGGSYCLERAQEVASAEQKIVAVIPEMIDLLIAAARRVTQAVPLSEDYSLSSDHPAAGGIAAMRRRRELGKAMARPAGVRDEIYAAEHLATEAETTADFPGSAEEFTRAKRPFPDVSTEESEVRSATG